MAEQNRVTQHAPTGVNGLNGLDLLALKELFEVSYLATPRFFFAPGWVDLMGSTTLDVGGWSLSMPVDRGVVVAAVPRHDRRIQVRLLMEGGLETLDLDDPQAIPADHWLGILLRVVHDLEMRQVNFSGADIVIASNLPPGIEWQDMTALAEALSLTFYELAGANVTGCSGSALGGQAWLKNQLTGTLLPVALGLSDLALVLCDSRVQPGLISTLAPQRKLEAGYGLDLLHLVQPDWQCWDDVDSRLLQVGQCGLEDEIILKRMRHCVSENARVQPMAEALRSGNAKMVEALWQSSLLSWQQDFEFTCLEWDTLAKLAGTLPGVVGSRVLTGGDFEGCTLHWVYPSVLGAFEAEVSERYESVFGCLPYISLMQPGMVAQELWVVEPVTV